MSRFGFSSLISDFKLDSDSDSDSDLSIGSFRVLILVCFNSFPVIFSGSGSHSLAHSVSWTPHYAPHVLLAFGFVFVSITFHMPL
jgi:hypothetical protein